MQKKWKCCRTNTEIVANFLHIFCKLVRIFLAFFLHFNFSYKNGFAIFLHYFCIFLHPDFWGSIFQLHLFCIFLAFISSFMFPRKRHSPTTQSYSLSQHPQAHQQHHQCHSSPGQAVGDPGMETQGNQNEV